MNTCLPPPRAVPHPHTCHTCGAEWTCQNTACADLPEIWCGKGPCYVNMGAPAKAYEHLRDAGHLCRQVAMECEYAERMDLAWRCEGLWRELLQARDEHYTREMLKAASQP